jgi:tetratricopeptide (TPR) repeat protein
LHGQGELDKAETYFERCVQSSGQDSPGRAKAYFRLGQVRFDRNDLAGARAFYERSLALHGDRAAPEDRAAVYSSLGLVEKVEDRGRRAVEHFEQALVAARESGNLLLVAAVLNNLGNLHRAQGGTEKALECLSQSIEARERAGDRHGLAICLNNIARIHFNRGEFSAVENATARALEIFEEIGDRKGVLTARCNLGEVRFLLGDFQQAQSLLKRNLELAERSNARLLLEHTRCNLARFELERGEAQLAEELLRLCLKTLPLDKAHELRNHVLINLAEALLDADRLEDAQDALEEALHLSSESRPGHVDLEELVTSRMRLYSVRGEPERAVDLGHSSIKSDPRAAPRWTRARLYRELGKAYRDLGPDWADRTEKYLALALEEFETMRCPHETAETLGQLSYYWKLLGEDDDSRDLEQRAETIFGQLGLPRRVSKLKELMEKE